MPEKISKIWATIQIFVKDYVLVPLKSLGFLDILDILILSMLIYVVYKFIKEKRATRLATGVGLLIIIYVVSDLLGMIALASILKNFYAVGIMAICVIFQPELREALEEVGSTSINNIKKRRKNGVNEEEAVLKVVEEISAAAFEISAKGDGALIVIERFAKLRYQMSEGTPVDAMVSRQLLANIFVNKAPLHDGAVIIRNGRIVAASCKSKTISENDEILEGLGTRHRAAVRISEISDAVVVVVSEESGTISVANNKLLKRDYNDIGPGGKHKSSDLRDDLFKLMTGRTIEDMVSSTGIADAELIVDDELKNIDGIENL